MEKSQKKLSQEELLRQVSHGNEMTKMVITPAYQELYATYSRIVKDYMDLKLSSNFESVMSDPIQLKYVIDSERRVHYQLEFFSYVDSTIAQGKEAEKLLQVMPV